jgi:hypothetical protein
VALPARGPRRLVQPTPRAKYREMSGATDRSRRPQRRRRPSRRGQVQQQSEENTSGCCWINCAGIETGTEEQRSNQQTAATQQAGSERALTTSIMLHSIVTAACDGRPSFVGVVWFVSALCVCCPPVAGFRRSQCRLPPGATPLPAASATVQSNSPLHPSPLRALAFCVASRAG